LLTRRQRQMCIRDSYYAMAITQHNLKKQGLPWDMVIVTKQENIAKYCKYNERLQLSINVIDYDTLNETNIFHIETYNSVLKDARFWGMLQSYGYNRCLVVQDDGFLINASTLSTYLDYDYVGAPWANTAVNHYIKNNISNDLVGNGGFSFRNVDAMHRICLKQQNEKRTLFYNNLIEIPEDVYFVKGLKQENGNICNRENALNFSIEQVIPHHDIKKVIGFHKFWMYHSAPSVWSIFKEMLDL
jgi:hypothetical protein